MGGTGGRKVAKGYCPGLAGTVGTMFATLLRRGGPRENLPLPLNGEHKRSGIPVAKGLPIYSLQTAQLVLIERLGSSKCQGDTDPKDG